MNIQNSLEKFLEKFDSNNLFDFYDIRTSRFNKVKLNQYVIYSSDYKDIIDRQEEVRFWVLSGNDITRNVCVGKLVGINTTLPPFIIETVDGGIIKCEYIYSLDIENTSNAESTNNEIKNNETKRLVIERDKDTVEVLLLPNKDGKGYQYINLTKGHICSCVFPTMEDALKDLERFQNLGKIKSWIEIPDKEKLEI